MKRESQKANDDIIFCITFACVSLAYIAEVIYSLNIIYSFKINTFNNIVIK